MTARKDKSKKDLSYYIDQDYKKVNDEMTALKGDIKRLSENVDSLTTKVDSGAEVSKANTIILHSVQETQNQTNDKLTLNNKKLAEVIDTLQGKTVLGQKELGALDKVHIVYEWYEDSHSKVVVLEKEKQEALKGLVDFVWAIKIIAVITGIVSIGGLIQLIMWVIPLIGKFFN